MTLERLYVRFGFAWSDGRAVRSMELFLPAPHGLGTTPWAGRVQAQHDGQAARQGREQRDRQTRAVARLPAAGERALPARLAPETERAGPLSPSQRSSHSSHASPPSASASHSASARYRDATGSPPHPGPLEGEQHLARGRRALREPLSRPGHDHLAPIAQSPRSARPARGAPASGRAFSSTRRWPRTRPAPPVRAPRRTRRQARCPATPRRPNHRRFLGGYAHTQYSLSL